jgi:hypothetical protein
MNEFPGVTGFSKSNLELLRRWVTFWSQLPPIAKQPASQLMGHPSWAHQAKHTEHLFNLYGEVQ